MLSLHSLINVADRYSRPNYSFVMYYFLILFVCLYMCSVFTSSAFLLITAQVISFSAINRVFCHVLMYVSYLYLDLVIGHITFAKLS